MSTQAGPRSAESEVAALPNGIVIEDLHGVDQMVEVEQLQIDVWGTEPGWVVPSHVLSIIADYGGILLGAELDGRLIGFVLGFLALQDGKLFHASHMLGIHPDHQAHGVGAALKWAQRKRALEQGLDLMTWTFDPLESRNAYFNLHKLGAVSRIYRENYYGHMRDTLNQGLPSDRFLIEWHLRDSARPSLNGRPLQILTNKGGKPELQLEEPAAGQALAVQVPRDIQAIKANDPNLALEWRLATRQAFIWALDKGFVARDFVGGAYILVPEGDRA
jgi:predicted GNAT superfamily acetyltransferase